MSSGCLLVDLLQKQFFFLVGDLSRYLPDVVSPQNFQTTTMLTVRRRQVPLLVRGAIARHSRRNVRFEVDVKVKMRSPLPSSLDPADNVWGFTNKEKSDELLRSQKKLLEVIEGTNNTLGSVRDQLSARGYDEKSFKEGCELAYRRVAELYEQGNSEFEDEHLDILEDRLALQLDSQLADFRLQSKVPRLLLEGVDAKVLCSVVIPKRPATNLITSLIRLIFGSPKLASTINHFISLGLHFTHPDWNELIVAVEYTTREKFELILKDDVANDPPRPYVNEMLIKQTKTAGEQQELISTITSLRGAPVSRTEERKHLFIFAADLAVQADALEKGTEADVLEFKLRSMGQLIQLPQGVEFQRADAS